MATLVTKTQIAKLDYLQVGNPQHLVSTIVVSKTNKASKTNGGFITFSDGTRFRKATAWSRKNVTVSVGAPQITRTTRKSDNVKYFADSTPGGYHVDLLFNNLGLPGTDIGTYSYVGYEIPSISPTMRSEAVTKALLKIADQKVNLAENLATIGQTARLFANSAKELAQFLRMVERDHSFQPWLNRTLRDCMRNGPKGMAQKYLEYVYGWKPLVQDVFALYKQLTGHSLQSMLLHAKGTSTRQAQSGVISRSDLSNATIEAGPMTDYATVRCNIWARVDPNWAGMRALNQLGLINPLSLIWEITPWSFVVDWVLPIGSVLSAMSAPAGLIFVDGSVAVKRKTSCLCRTWYNSILDPVVYSIQSHQPATFNHSSEGYTREILSTWPLPGFWFDPDPLRGDRIFKASALVIAALGKERNSRLG